MSAEVTATRLQVTELWYLIFGKKGFIMALQTE